MTLSGGHGADEGSGEAGIEIDDVSMRALLSR